MCVPLPPMCFFCDTNNSTTVLLECMYVTARLAPVLANCVSFLYYYYFSKSRICLISLKQAYPIVVEAILLILSFKSGFQNVTYCSEEILSGSHGCASLQSHLPIFLVFLNHFGHVFGWRYILFAQGQFGMSWNRVSLIV